MLQVIWLALTVQSVSFQSGFIYSENFALNTLKTFFLRLWVHFKCYKLWQPNFVPRSLVLDNQRM